MKVIFENQYISMVFYADNSFMETIWTTSTLMGQEIYRDLLKSYLKHLQENRPDKLLIDSRKAEYTITPEDQDWININIYPQTVEAGIRKLAFLVGSDLFMNVSLEQVSEDSSKHEEVKNKIKQKFFDNYNEALEWLHL